MKLKNKLLIASLFAIASLSGCSTLTDQRYQTLTIKTSIDGRESIGAKCTLTNDYGSWLVQTPATLHVRSGFQSMVVECADHPYHGLLEVSSDMKKSTAVNFPASVGLAAVAGGPFVATVASGTVVFGLADVYTGKGYQYPSEITVNLFKQ